MAPAEADLVTDAPEEPTGRKGRPTPKRSEREAARRRPLVPADRKAAAREAKTASRVRRGEDKYLAERDRGPERAYVRQYVDARRNIADYFLPAALVFIFLNMFAMRYVELAALVVFLLYLLVLGAIFDTFLMWRKLKPRLEAKFGSVRKGTAMYAGMRAFQLRRSRMPKPIFAERGVYPE